MSALLHYGCSTFVFRWVLTSKCFYSNQWWLKREREREREREEELDWVRIQIELCDLFFPRAIYRKWPNFEPYLKVTSLDFTLIQNFFKWIRTVIRPQSGRLIVMVRPTVARKLQGPYPSLTRPFLNCRHYSTMNSIILSKQRFTWFLLHISTLSLIFSQSRGHHFKAKSFMRKKLEKWGVHYCQNVSLKQKIIFFNAWVSL